MTSVSRVRLLIVTILLAGLTGCGPAEPLRLGFISGQTGAFADLGAAGLNGAILAVEQRNQKGGINGQAITLVIRDDEHSPPKAKAAFESLIKEQVVAIIGPMTSAVATELIPLADKEKILLMGGTVVTNRATGKDDYFLRAIAPARHYAAYSAGEHYKALKPQRVHIVFDAANRDYAENWARDYESELERLGVPQRVIVEVDSRSPHANQATLLAKINANSPDLVTFATSAKTAAGFMLRLREKNQTVRFSVSAWAANRLLVEVAGGAAEGTLVEQYHNLHDTSPAYKQFDTDYRQRFKFGPDYAAVISYDATNIVLDGLKSHSRRAGLKESLLQKQTFSGLQTTITLDRFGDATRPGFTTTVKGGQFAPL